MDMLPRILLLLGLIFLINVPFGYWRANSKRFSWQWILAVHIPVPIAIGLRLLLLSWMWPLIPVFIAAYSIGQFAGGKLRLRLAKYGIPLSSNLVIDLVRLHVKELSSNPG